jgi:hypothetical protein
VRPATDQAFALVLPEVSTVAMNLFLDAFAETLAPDEHAVVVLDQAGWHVANALIVPDNLSLVPLPPYSPELNPVERVWLHLRERYLSHRLHADYDAVVDAACSAWNALRNKEYDAAHMLSPMPLAITLGAGSKPRSPTPCPRSRTSTARRSRWR